MLYLYSKMKDYGYTVSDFKLKKALVGAEPHSEEIRQRIEKLFGIDVYNSYGLSEMNGPGVAFECEEKSGMHLWEDSYYMEIIDRNTLEELPEGETGELVLSILIRDATPILRYRTRDLTSIIPGPCSCGRISRRISRIKGRTDDMLIINGVNVFPSQIEEVIMKMPEVGTNYRILAKREGLLDKLIVQTEVGAAIFSDDARDMNALKRRIIDNLRALITISPTVELHEPGILPVQEGKAIRVVDERRE